MKEFKEFEELQQFKEETVSTAAHRNRGSFSSVS
jgi:hypothetical protein